MTYAIPGANICLQLSNVGEMHYHLPLMNLFRAAFGLRPGGQINFFKYSPQKECFVGFDQAYVMTDLGVDDFFNILQQSAMSNNYNLREVIVGYFLQFKVVKPMQKWSRYTPPQVVNRPYFRANLDTKKNAYTGLSQHELLFNLSRNRGAMVYYACPMLFERTELYEVNVDLDKLRLADLQTCPESYSDNDNHYIFFNDINDVPIWRSEPVVGKAITPFNFAHLLVERARALQPTESMKTLFDILTNVEAVGLSEQAKYFEGKQRRDILELTHDALIIIRIRRD
jgi:hypothetical protein